MFLDLFVMWIVLSFGIFGVWCSLLWAFGRFAHPPSPKREDLDPVQATGHPLHGRPPAATGSRIRF